MAVAVAVNVKVVDQVVLDEVDLTVNLVELEHLDKVIMVEDPLVALVAVAVEEKVASVTMATPIQVIIT